MQKIKMQTREEIEQHLLDRAASDEEFRALLLDNPHEALHQELGYEIPDNLDLTVHEEDTSSFHLVLPHSEQLTDEDMIAIAGGGVSVNISI